VFGCLKKVSGDRVALFASAGNPELFGMARLCLMCRLFQASDGDGRGVTIADGDQIVLSTALSA